MADIDSSTDDQRVAGVTAGIMKALTAITALLASVLMSDADQSVTLEWDPSPDPDVQGTIVHYGGASRAYTNHTYLGNVTRATIGGLQLGGTYYFAVTVTNSLGLESEYSNEVWTNIPARPLPVVITNLIWNPNLKFNVSITTE